MKRADSFTIQEKSIPSLTLMERAGRAIAEEVKGRITDKNQVVAVVCGGGNNGGDGFVVARLLKEEGFSVCAVCRAKTFSPECEEMKNRYVGEILSTLPQADFVVDALFGTGLSREVTGENAELIEEINASGAFVISADIPSGLNGDNGLMMGACVRADVTVAIGGLKTGLFLADGRDCCGEILTKDIGIEPLTKDIFLFEEEDFFALFPKRKSHSHKGTYGRACLVAGSLNYSGAALLAANAAMRTGAGYTTLCVPHNLFPHFVGKIPEILLKDMGGGDCFVFSENNFSCILAYPAVAFGSGVGVGEETYKILNYLLSEYTGTLVLDADALTTLAKYGAERLKEAKCKVVLTPHLKEFSALAKVTIEEAERGGEKKARRFAKENGVVLCLKSNTTIVTDGEKSFLVAEGTPALSKGGSGDALFGILCAMLSRGVPPLEGAAGASFLLSRAGKIAEETLSEYSVSGSDVISAIGKALLF